MKMQAAVFRKVHEPLTIESVEFDKPWGREVLVCTAATGVCHSDLHVADGQSRWPLDRPIVLGHEGAGAIIERRVTSDGCRVTNGFPLDPQSSSLVVPRHSFLDNLFSAVPGDHTGTRNADGGPAGPDTLLPK
jgi:hypothetical protein